MTTTRVELELDTDMSSAQRFPVWMALSVFSAVALAAVNSSNNNKADNDPRGSQDKWVLAVTCISMILSFLATAAYLFVRGIFVGQKPEAGMIVLLLGFWAAGLPTIMNPNNNIAVLGETVVNANLYFFSWLAFAAALYLSSSLAQENYGLDVVVASTSTKSARWYGLTASSLVVMGAAVRIFKSADCDNNSSSSSELCKRTKFAISAGTIGFVFAMVLTYLTQKGLTIVVETAATVFLLALWCFGVSYITFGDGPGSQIGNLFFSSWICFILCVFLFGACFREFMEARVANAQNNNNGASGDGGDDNAAAAAEEPQAYPEVPAEDEI